MKLSIGQKKELVVLKFYTPPMLRELEIKNEHIKEYFTWSDRGIGNIVSNVVQEHYTKKYSGLSALFYGKRYRDLAITTYIEDWDFTCFAEDFVSDPKEVAEFVSKALNKPEILWAWNVWSNLKENSVY